MMRELHAPQFRRKISTSPVSEEEGETQPEVLSPVHWRGVILLGSIAGTMVALGFPQAFLAFRPYDDEGFYLMSLRTLARHGGVYSHIYSAYGPVYHFVTLGFLTIFRIPLTHDGGRIYTLLAWDAIAFATAMFTWRQTRSVVLAAVALPLAFLWLSPLVREPLQPACVAFALTLLLLCLAQRREWWCGRHAMVVGSVCMALVLVKINLGIFAIAAVGWTLVAITPAPRWLRWTTHGTALVLPLVVLGTALNQHNVLLYFLTVECGVGALILAAPAHRIRMHRPVTWRWLVAGFVGTLVAAVLLSLGFGENLGAMVVAIVVNPLRLAVGKGYYPIEMTWALFLSALCLAAMCILVRGGWRWPGVAARAIALPLVFVTLFMPTWPAFVDWALVPILLLPRDTGGSVQSSARVCLAALIVFNELQAYPIAGSQLSFATFLIVPASLLVTRDLIDELRVAAWRPRVPEVGAVLATATLAGLLGAQIFGPIVSYWRTYRSQPPLGLRGSELIRPPASQAIDLEATVDDIRGRSCASLITYPGMLSFYVWSGLPPPRGIVMADGMNWLQPALRGPASTAVSRARAPCLVTNWAVVWFWSILTPLPDWPALDQQLHVGFDYPARYGDYAVSAR